MAFTGHGHQIPGSTVEPSPFGGKIARCGGPGLCPACSAEAIAYKRPSVENSGHPSVSPEHLKADNLQLTARGIVRNYITRMELNKDQAFLVHIVWFSKTLQNWKALVTTSLENGMYFEITHNGDKHESYLDVYSKVDNLVIGPNGGPKHGSE